MRISYLDILLATGAILLILYGTSRQQSFKYEEGSALVLIAEMPQHNERDATEIEIDFENPLHQQPVLWSDTNPIGFISRRELSFDFSRMRADGTFRVTGQPDLHLKIAVEIKRTIRSKRAVDLFEVNKELEQLSKSYTGERAVQLQENKRLLVWSAEGEDILSQCAILDESSRRSLVSKWSDRCPEGKPSRLYSELTSVENGHDSYEICKADALAYSVIIAHRLLSDAVPIPSGEAMETNVGVKNAIWRATRHIEACSAEFSLLTERLPPWCLSNTSMNLGVDTIERMRNAQAAEAFQSYDQNGGLFGNEDIRATDVAVPPSAFWSFAGHPGRKTTEWQLESVKGDTIVLRAELIVNL